MIEAIVTIFRDLDLNQKTPFAYELDYSCRGHFIQVVSKDNQVKIWDEDRVVKKSGPTKRALSYLSSNAKTYLPSHVFAYYSGRNERIESIFQDHQRRFSKALREGSDELGNGS